jgi:hypothetical protein
VKIGMMEAFKKLAVGPDALPDIIFASIGRTIWKVRGQQRLAAAAAAATAEVLNTWIWVIRCYRPK